MTITDEPANPTDDQDQAPADTAAAEDQDQAPDQDQGDDSEPDGREAARYRRQLKDTEADRDALTARLDGMLTAEADRLITDQGVKPAAVWAAGSSLADVLNPAGQVDADRVATIVDHAIRTLGLSVGRPPTFEPGSRTAHTQSQGWADLLRGRQ